MPTTLPSTDQVQSTLRWVLTYAAGIATAKGWLTPADAGSLVTNVLAAIGPIGGIVTVALGFWVHRPTGLIQSVNNNIAGAKVVREAVMAPALTVAPSVPPAESKP